VTTSEASAPLRWQLGAVAFAAACGLLLALTNGDIVVALLPVAGLFALYFVLRAPLGTTATLIIIAALLFDNVAEQPGMGLFKTPLYAPGKPLYRALSYTLGIPGLKVFGVEALVALLAVLAVWRGPTPAERAHPRAARAFMVAFAISAVACLVWEAWGIANGGNVRFSMLQFRPLLMATALPIVLAPCLRHPRAVRAILTAFVAIAFVRAAFGIYGWATIIRFGIRGPVTLGGGSYVMTHSDSVLAAVAVIICVVMLYQRPSLRAIVVCSTALPVITMGMIVNNRRLAFVALVIALGCIYLVADRLLRRRVHATVALSLPAVFLYILFAWNSHGVWAKPVQTLKSVVVAADTSAQTRDVENFNLTVTLRRKPVAGWGFGHEYVEFVKMYDISHAFEAYLYVPHNSVLWLLGAAGVVGFTLIWWFLGAAAFFAARAYRFAKVEEERLLPLVTIGAIVVYGVQAFGDMGLQSWMGAFTLGPLIALCGTQVVRVGAWSERDVARETP
jgi:hypothetical protein